MNTVEELKKYEAELATINSKLIELEGQKDKILRVGIRVEGVVAFLRGKIEEEAKADALQQG